MPIIQYVPPTKKIVDNRSPEGGYYIAKCEICGTEFYPQRGNAKYCTPNCGLIAHRTSVANGTATKRSPKQSKKPLSVKSPTTRVTGATNVYKHIKKLIDTRGDREKILDTCKELMVGETDFYKTFIIAKLSTNVYSVTR